MEIKLDADETKLMRWLLKVADAPYTNVHWYGHLIHKREDGRMEVTDGARLHQFTPMRSSDLARLDPGIYGMEVKVRGNPDVKGKRDNLLLIDNQTELWTGYTYPETGLFTNARFEEPEMWFTGWNTRLITAAMSGFDDWMEVSVTKGLVRLRQRNDPYYNRVAILCATVNGVQ
jgi:hypothetical protein